MNTILVNSKNSKTSDLHTLSPLLSVPTWNDKFELPDESYSVSCI